MRSESGAVTATAPLLIPGSGVAITGTESYAGAANARGAVIVRSQAGPVHVGALRTAVSGAFTYLPATVAEELNGGNGRQTLAHFAENDFWRTSLTLSNASQGPGTALLNFRNGMGAPQTLRLRGAAAPGSSFADAMAPGSSRATGVEPGNALPQPAWVELSSTSSLGAFAIFEQRVPGWYPAEAAVPLMLNPSPRIAMLFDNVNGSTAFTLANPGTAPATAAVTAWDATGALIFTGTIDVPARGQLAAYLGDRFYALAGQRGVVEFASPAGLTGFTLRWGRGGVLAALPALVW